MSRLPAAVTRRVLWGVLAALLIGRPVQGGQWDYGRTPILFIHGYFVVSQAGDATWANFVKRASEDGWPEEYLRTPSFRDVRGCNDDHVEEIEGWVRELVAATGFDQVDVVCHSMGCLNLLSWMKSDHCGARRVRRVVTLAGAMHGTTVACLDPFSCGAKHMCIGSRDGAWRDNPFLADLNACDETPGDVQYTCLWSEYDEIIVPPSGSTLAGARNLELDTPWVEHGGIFLCDECWDRTREALLEGTGQNDDGPGWECLPEACRPPPERPEDGEVADLADGPGGGDAPDAGTADDLSPARDAWEVGPPEGEDGGMEEADPGERDAEAQGVEGPEAGSDPGDPRKVPPEPRPRKAGGCAHGAPAGSPVVLWPVLLWAAIRSRGRPRPGGP